MKKRIARDFRTYPLAYDEGVQIAEVRDTLRKHTKVELLIPHPCVVERTIDDAIKKEEEPIETPACLAVCPPFDAASIAHFKVYKGLGGSEVKLKNGIRLIMKPTKNADSTLYLTSFAPFGTSSLSDEEYPLLEGMGGYMDMGGIAKVDSKLLSDYLFQQKMSLTVTLENHWHGFIGMSSTANALEFFNLIYEKIFAPELKYEDFEEIRQELIERKGRESMLEKMLKRDSGRQLSARINELMGRAIPHSPVDSFAERLNLDSIADFYKKLYARPEGTAYVICGNFNPDSLMRQFVSVFGRIPVSTDKTAYAYPRFELPDKTHIEGFRNENETQILSDYLFYGHYQPCQKNTLMLKLMGDLIRNRLISVLRERESLVYSPYISLFYKGIPWHTFYFDIYISADDRNMKQIDMLLKEILWELKEKKVEAKELQTIKRSFLLAKCEALGNASPTEWRTGLVGLLKNGESLADFEQYESCLGSITPANLRKAFKEWINLDNYVLLYLSNKKTEE